MVKHDTKQSDERVQNAPRMHGLRIARDVVVNYAQISVMGHKKTQKLGEAPLHIDGPDLQLKAGTFPFATPLTRGCLGLL